MEAFFTMIIIPSTIEKEIIQFGTLLLIRGNLKASKYFATL